MSDAFYKNPGDSPPKKRSSELYHILEGYYDSAELHYGPGSHPSGSSQDVHGEREGDSEKGKKNKPVKTVAYQGRGKKGSRITSKEGLIWASTQEGPAKTHANIEDVYYPYREPPEHHRIMHGEIRKIEFDLDNPMYVSSKETLWEREREAEVIAKAKKLGHDGVIIVHSDDWHDYVTWDESKVKVLGLHEVDLHYGPGSHPGTGTSQDVHAPGTFREKSQREGTRRGGYNPKELQPPLPGFKTNEEIWQHREDLNEERSQYFKKVWAENQAALDKEKERIKKRVAEKVNRELVWKRDDMTREEYAESVSDYPAEVYEVWENEVGYGWREDDPYELIENTYSFYDEETGIESRVTAVWNLNDRAIRVEGIFYEEGGYGKIGNFETTLTENGVYNNYIALEYMQGTGFGSRMTRHQESMLLAAGAQSISLQANIDVGGYAWARMGFDFAPYTEHGDGKDAIMMRYSNLWDEWYEEAAANVFADSETEGFILPYLEKPDIEHAWELAALDHPYTQYLSYPDNRFGKEVLLDTNWDAIKHLDPEGDPVLIGELYYASK